MNLDPSARQRLDHLVEDVLEEPSRVRVHFPAAARVVGRDAPHASNLFAPPTEDLVRVELMLALACAVADEPKRLATEVAALYRYGDADEKRAVLLALPSLALDDEALPLVHDALRSNDARLVAAAMGRYAAAHLDPRAWRQGVLKCLFVGIPLSVVADLDLRADDELARMAASFAEERSAAGRSVPADVGPLTRTRPDPFQDIHSTAQESA